MLKFSHAEAKRKQLNKENIMRSTTIWNNRELIGHAKNEKSAEKVIRSKLQTIPKGWKVSVKRRSEFMVVDCGLNDGFVYSIHP